jgi:hypothetical protein
MVLHPGKSDFKDSAQLQLDRASAFVLRDPIPSNSNKQNVAVSWRNIPLQVLRSKPNFLQREADPLPVSLLELVRASACNGPKTPSINL